METPRPPPLTDIQIGDVKRNIISGARELLLRYKAQFHKVGAVDFEIPEDAEPPLWLRMVMEELKLRRRGWRVVWMEPLNGRGNRKWRVFWNGWAKNLPRRRRP